MEVAPLSGFLIFSLSCSSGRLFALLKFEDEKVLSYDYDVKLIFPVSLTSSVVSVNRDKGEIIIKDTITLGDFELNTSGRTRT